MKIKNIFYLALASSLLFASCVKEEATDSFENIKLDKTFVNNQNDKMWTILQNTVRMIKDLNMEIVVEGIETKDMVKKFSDLHCDFIQGFYFSKPVPRYI